MFLRFVRLSFQLFLTSTMIATAGLVPLMQFYPDETQPLLQQLLSAKAAITAQRHTPTFCNILLFPLNIWWLLFVSGPR